MAGENTSVGGVTISLDLEASGDLKAQLEKLSASIGEQINASLKNIGNLDLSKMTESISDNLKATFDTAFKGVTTSIDTNLKSINDTISASINAAKENALAAVAQVKNSATEMVQGLVAMTRKIKIPANFSIPTNIPMPNQNTGINPIQPRAPPVSIPQVNIPKFDTGVNMEALKAQIDNLAQGIDITNEKIEQQKEKLAQLKESYNMAFDGERKK